MFRDPRPARGGDRRLDGPDARSAPRSARWSAVCCSSTSGGDRCSCWACRRWCCCWCWARAAARVPRPRAPAGSTCASVALSLAAVLAVHLRPQGAGPARRRPCRPLCSCSGSRSAWSSCAGSAAARPADGPAALPVPAFGASLVTYTLGLLVMFGAYLFIAQYLQLVLGLGAAPGGAVDAAVLAGVRRGLDPGAGGRPPARPAA